MKKLIFTILFLFGMCSQAFGAWTITASKVFKAEHYIYWKVVCVSDSSTLTATNLLATATTAEAAVTMPTDLLREIQGTTMMIMDVIPGTGGAAPTGTIDITLANSLIQLYADTGIANGSNTSGKDLSEDYNQYPVIGDQLNITFNDIGDAVDQVTLAFLCWIEDK